MKLEIKEMFILLIPENQLEMSYFEHVLLLKKNDDTAIIRRTDNHIKGAKNPVSFAIWADPNAVIDKGLKNKRKKAL